jgi:large subunit ribosomal protein L35
MPKIKTHSGASKRFKISSGGRVKYKQPGLRHLLSGMSSNRGRRLRKAAYLNKVDSQTVKKLLPYS